MTQGLTSISMLALTALHVAVASAHHPDGRESDAAWPWLSLLAVVVVFLAVWAFGARAGHRKRHSHDEDRRQ